MSTGGVVRGLALAGAFVQQLLRFIAHVLLLLIVKERFIRARVLRANHAAAIDEDEKRNHCDLLSWPLYVVPGGNYARRANRKRHLELRNERGDVRLIIQRRFHYLQTLRRKLRVNDVPQLRGLLAVRATGKDKGEAQNFAAIIAHFDLLAVAELNGKIRRLARNLCSPQRTGRQNQTCNDECAHGEN